MLSELIEAAGECAKAAAGQARTPVQIAGSIPPLGPSYKYEEVLSDPQMEPIYAEIVATIAPFSDFLLIETMSCIREAAAASQAATAPEGGVRMFYVHFVSPV